MGDIVQYMSIKWVNNSVYGEIDERRKLQRRRMGV